MRYPVLALAALLVSSTVHAQDADRSVKGGISVAGWKGRIDRRPAGQGKTINDSKFASEGKDLRLSIGPAAFYYNPANTASGDFTVKATFKEHKMTASHPHSFGIFIGGNDLESDTETLMYCIVYGNGTYSVKTFHGSNVQTLVNGEKSDAIHQADATGASTNEVGWSVKGGKSTCMINGTAVKSFDKFDVVAGDKLKSLDGVYGIRVSHNLELTVSGFGMSK